MKNIITIIIIIIIIIIIRWDESKHELILCGS